MILFFQPLPLFFSSEIFDNRSRGPHCSGVSDCDALADIVSEEAFYDGSSVYAHENQEFWSNTEMLNPQCLFRLTFAGDASAGVRLIRLSNASFAVRGGGPIGIEVLQSPIWE